MALLTWTPLIRSPQPAPVYLQGRGEPARERQEGPGARAMPLPHLPGGPVGRWAVSEEGGDFKELQKLQKLPYSRNYPTANCSPTA